MKTSKLYEQVKPRSVDTRYRGKYLSTTYLPMYVFQYILVLGLFTRNPGKPERVFESLEYFRAGARSIYDLRVRAGRV